MSVGDPGTIEQIIVRIVSIMIIVRIMMIVRIMIIFSIMIIAMIMHGKKPGDRALPGGSHRSSQ